MRGERDFVPRAGFSADLSSQLPPVLSPTRQGRMRPRRLQLEPGLLRAAGRSGSLLGRPLRLRGAHAGSASERGGDKLRFALCGARVPSPRSCGRLGLGTLLRSWVPAWLPACPGSITVPRPLRAWVPRGHRARGRVCGDTTGRRAAGAEGAGGARRGRALTGAVSPQ